MIVTFDSPTLAALCSSERRLIDRWGQDVGRTVGRRFLDLAAIEAVDIDRLPGAHVSGKGDGMSRLTFGGEIVIDGVITEADRHARTTGDEDRIVVTRVTVKPGAR